jgi:hypothetical protein
VGHCLGIWREIIRVALSHGHYQKDPHHDEPNAKVCVEKGYIMKIDNTRHVREDRQENVSDESHCLGSRCAREEDPRNKFISMTIRSSRTLTYMVGG